MLQDWLIQNFLGLWATSLPRISRKSSMIIVAIGVVSQLKMMWPLGISAYVSGLVKRVWPSIYTSSCCECWGSCHTTPCNLKRISGPCWQFIMVPNSDIRSLNCCLMPGPPEAPGQPTYKLTQVCSWVCLESINVSALRTWPSILLPSLLLSGDIGSSTQESPRQIHRSYLKSTVFSERQMTHC